MSAVRARPVMWISLFAFCLFLGGIGCQDERPGPGTNPDSGPIDAVTDVDEDSGGDDADEGEDAGDTGDTGEDGGEPDDGGAEDTDGAIDGGGDSGGDAISCTGDLRPCNGSCVDITSNQSHCGDCGITCDGNSVCREGTCECPRYHEPCNGVCEPVHVDGDNCGSCGNTCGAGEACSSGACKTTCLPGRSICGNSCVNKETDNQHCGGCGVTCGSDEGCVNGNCVPRVPTDSSGTSCVGGGPPLNITRPNNSDSDTCLGNLAEGLFTWGLCTCNDLVVQNNLDTDAWDSTVGPYVPGGVGGGIGSNQSVQLGALSNIQGPVWASGSAGLNADGDLNIRQVLRSGGDVQTDNTTTVQGNAYVNGDVTATGTANFEKDLTLPSGAVISGNVTTGNTVRSPVNVKNACGGCAQNERIDVGAIVDAHSGSNNDNDAINLSSSVLSSPGGNRRLDLPCGKYFLDEIVSAKRVTIVAHGRTALFIDGDIDVDIQLHILPDPGAELDIFVAGNVELTNNIQIGSPAYPASTRMYVGGATGMNLMNQGTIGAYFYAVPGSIMTSNNFELFGGMVASNFQTGNNPEIHYDREVLDAGESCPPPEDPNGGGGDAGDAGDVGDVGDGGTPDGSVMDSGGDVDGGDPVDPICSDKDESCSVDDDCCAPLVCGSSNTCVLSECRIIQESCSENSDCCSDLCVQTTTGAQVCQVT